MSKFVRIVANGAFFMLAILTQIVFLALKLTETVAWEWLLVCIPAISLGGFFIILFILGFFMMMRYSRDYLDL